MDDNCIAGAPGLYRRKETQQSVEPIRSGDLTARRRSADPIRSGPAHPRVRGPVRLEQQADQQASNPLPYIRSRISISLGSMISRWPRKRRIF